MAETETPSTIAKAVRGFIQKHPTISVAFFAKEIVRRSQGTLSTLLNNPPSTFPSGAGREPWEAMKKFLASEDEQKNLLERKGEYSYFTELLRRCCDHITAMSWVFLIKTRKSK